jgi:tRNA threonylcarbamoyladenosine biosynthesis protein TsaE
MVPAMTASPPPSLDLRLRSLEETEALAQRIAAELRPGDAVLLSGPLGAAKPPRARADSRAAAGDPALDVPSPSFTLVQSYETPKGMVHHYDLWRVEPGSDLRELGLDDAFGEITLIEWPDRLEAQVPANALTILIDPRPDGVRHAHLSGWPDRLRRLMDQP